MAETIEDIRPEPLAQALSERYLAYALSTITQRALPYQVQPTEGAVRDLMSVPF